MKNRRTVIENRRKLMLEEFAKNPAIDIDNLAKKFRVSNITVRRDIKSLEEEGFINNKNGKLVYTSENKLESLTFSKFNKQDIKKQLIGCYVGRKLIEDGDIIFMNSGSTVKAIIPYIDSNKNVTIVTNNLLIANMKLTPNIHVLLTGGEILRPNVLSGDYALNVFNTVTASKTFLGVNGISVNEGLSTVMPSEGSLSRAMVNNCSGPITVVADSSKIGRNKNFHSMPISRISRIVTDSEADNLELEKIRELGIEVVTVYPGCPEIGNDE